jgi:molybdenum cofactor biosynthesis enzyme MoaA
MLVTNGTLLHKHDWDRIGKSALNALYLSLDSMDQDTLGALRCGSKVDKITENVSGLLGSAPNVRLHINIVVTTRNIDGIDDVIAWGKEQDCATFTLREMYLPPTPSTEEGALQPLVLPEGRFGRLEASLRERWPDASFQFANRQHLEEEYDYWAPRLL